MRPALNGDLVDRYYRPDAAFCRIETEVLLPDAAIRLARFNWDKPVDRYLMLSNSAMLDVSLTPRLPSRIRFLGRSQNTYSDRLGKLVFLPPNVPFHAIAEPGGHRSLQLQLSSQFYDHIVWTDNQLRGGLNIGRSSIWNICNKIIRELQSPGLASAAYIDALAHILIIELMRLFSGDNSSQRSVGGMPGWRLSRLDERIARVGAPASLQELAALCGLSQRQLMRSFQQARGESLGAYVDRVCLENVKLALAGSTDSISEIADRFGFASLSSLSTTFRNKVGMTPRQYRAHNFQQPNLARI